MGCHRDLYWVHCCLLFILMIWTRALAVKLANLGDDTKVGRVIRTDQDARELQGDLDRLYEWARK